MRKSGLRLDSEIGSLHLNPVQVVADAREIAAADAIIFAVKMRDTESAAEIAAARWWPAGATVFTFQNGVESAERIGRIVGARQAWCRAWRASPLAYRRARRDQADRQLRRLEFAESDGKPSPRVTAFHEACKARRHRGQLSDNIGATLWMKFAMLAPHVRHDGADARADRPGARQRRNRARCCRPRWRRRWPWAWRARPAWSQRTPRAS